MEDRILLRIDSILRHIEKVLSQTKGLRIQELEEQDLLLRATCFSIAQIGEQMVKLEDQLGTKYPGLPWRSARGMRNFIVHDYDHIDVAQVHSTVNQDLPALKTAFLIIKSVLKKE